MNTETITHQIEDNIQIRYSKWFEEFISTLQADQFIIQTGQASESLKSKYRLLVEGSDDDLATVSKLNANRHFIRKATIDYLTILIQANHLPQKLAFDMDDSELLTQLSHLNQLKITL